MNYPAQQRGYALSGDDPDDLYTTVAKEVIETISNSGLSTASGAGVDHSFQRQLLESGDLDLWKRMRIRLAGWKDPNTFSYEVRQQDMNRFRALEKQETAWIDALRSSENSIGDRNDNGLTAGQQAALAHFEEFGGHACVLTDEQHDYIHNNGVVLLLELEVRTGVFAVVGTISALSEAPFTLEDPLHPMTPNFDLRDIGIPDIAKTHAYESAHQRLVIWRTTIARQLISADIGECMGDLEEKPMRRMGGGAALKDVLFRFAQMHGKELLTFNIGALFNTEDRGTSSALLKSNKPSLGHNNWMNLWAWRVRYHDVLLGGNNNPTVVMHWTAFDGRIEDGIRVFEEDGGILRGKGILGVKNFEADAQRIFEQVEHEEAAGIRNPYQSPWAGPQS